tara:strand:- start:397 stop:585 length:189 start_codon:yes stop_codon:yes gene_type:complete
MSDKFMATGEELRASFKRTGAICPVCNGNGYLSNNTSPASYVDCPMCGCEGEILEEKSGEVV